MQWQVIQHNPPQEPALRSRVVSVTNNRQERPMLDRRHAQRVPVHMHVLYTSDQDDVSCDGEGHVRNLSKKGCQIVGTIQLVQGSHVTLSLDLMDGRPPLCLPATTVCWSDGNRFSVKFPPMTDEARHRLQRLVLKSATSREISRTHTAFRII